MPDSPDVVRLEVLGPLRVRRGVTEIDAGPRQQRCLLAVLLARPDRPVSMTELVGLLWGDDAPASATNVIHKYVGALRRLIEPGLPPRSAGSHLRRDGNGYRFSAGLHQLDLVEFRTLVAEARKEDNLDDYLRALHLWRGPAGGDLADSAAATAVFAGLDSEFFDAVVAAAALAVEQARPDRVLALVRAAATTSPLNEPIHASLITLLAAAGQRAEALAVYEAIRARLGDVLGLDPGPDLRQARERAVHGAGPRPALVDQPAQLPPDLPLFTGRETELATLQRLIDHRVAAGPLVVALDGMAGVGKSTLAVHFAHRIAAEFPDGQLYLDLRRDEEGGDAVASLLYGLCVAAADIPETYDAQVGTLRSLTAGKRLLLLLDNVRDADQVRPLLPASSGSLVLVTCRRPLIGLAALHGAHLMHLDPPGHEAARELLRRRLSAGPDRIAARDDAEPEALDEILDCCGRLPLALAILGARLSARPRLSLPAVAAELRSGDSKLDVFPRGEVGDPRNSFIWSYRQLTPAAARMFRLLSVPLAEGVSAEACAALAAVPPAVARGQLAELTEAALVIEDGSGRFTVHILIRAYARELFLALDPEPDRRAAISRMLQYYLYSSLEAQAALDTDSRGPALSPPLSGVVPERPASAAEAEHWFATEHPVLREAMKYAAGLGYGIEPWQLALAVRPYLERRGYFHDWEEVTRTALRAAREQGDRTGEAQMLRSLAGAREAFGDHDEARDLLWAADDVAALQ